MTSESNKKIGIMVLTLLWVGIFAYVTKILLDLCKMDNSLLGTTDSTTSATTDSTTGSTTDSTGRATTGPKAAEKKGETGAPLETTKGTDEMNNTFDYTENFENFEGYNPPDIGDKSADTREVANQNVNFNIDPSLKNINLDPDIDLNELQIDGTDALIAASADRFYSVDTKGQTNRNASNDLRGDLPIVYNDNYTPFNQSAIYGEPLVPAGRL